MTKICKKCGVPQDLENFDKGANKDGRKSWCKICSKEANHARYNKNKEKITKDVNKWQSKNPDKTATYKKDFYHKHKIV